MKIFYLRYINIIKANEQILLNYILIIIKLNCLNYYGANQSKYSYNQGNLFTILL